LLALGALIARFRCATLRYDPAVTSLGHERDSIVGAWITGVGLVTPLGRSTWKTASARLAGRTIADRLASAPEGADALTLARLTGGSSFAGFTTSDPAVELAERAAREALADARRDRDDASLDEPWPTIVASSKGAIGALLGIGAAGAEHHRDGRATVRAGRQAAALGPHAYLAGELRDRLGLDEITCVVSACATSLAALDQASRRFAAGQRRVLIVAVESAMHPLFVHAYRRLGVLAPVSPTVEHRGRPLDRSRAGFTLNECAAAVALERDDSFNSRQRSRGGGAHAKLLTTACMTQPHDLVRAATRFATLTTLTRRLITSDRPIALLQPHATGTRDNDEREMQALADAFGEQSVKTPVYASKGALGHPLGAAGLVNVVLGCLFARIGQRPPMPWLEDPIATAFPLRAEAEPISRGAQVCVSAGFGGHIAGACFDTDVQ